MALETSATITALGYTWQSLPRILLSCPAWLLYHVVVPVGLQILHLRKNLDRQQDTRFCLFEGMPRSINDSLRTSMFFLALRGGHHPTLPLPLKVHEATLFHPDVLFIFFLLLSSTPTLPILSVCRPRGMIRRSAIGWL